MGTETIPTRANGQTIDETWFNLLKQVLSIDVVPRNGAGIATSLAGRLGTTLLPWAEAITERIRIMNGTRSVSLVAPAGMSSDYTVTMGSALPAGRRLVKLDNAGLLTYDFLAAVDVPDGTLPFAKLTGGITGLLQRQSFTGNGNWVVPTGVNNVIVIGAGGGGGGGSGNNTSGANRAGGGGGSGAPVLCYTVPVTPGQTATITVGSSGAGGSSQGANGSDGGQSVFLQGNTRIVFPGGRGGSGASGTSFGAGGLSRWLGGGGARGGWGGDQSSGFAGEQSLCNLTGNSAGGNGGNGDSSIAGGGGGGASIGSGGNGGTGGNGGEAGTQGGGGGGSPGGGPGFSPNGGPGGAGAVYIYWIQGA